MKDLQTKKNPINEKALNKIKSPIAQKRVREFLTLLDGKLSEEEIKDTLKQLKKEKTKSQYNSTYYALKKYFHFSSDSIQKKAEFKEYFNDKDIKPFVIGYSIKEIPTDDSVNNAVQESNPRLSHVIEFLANTGLRVSELINIKLSDISLNGKAHIRVTRLKRKLPIVTTIDLPREYVEEIVSFYHSKTLNEIKNKNQFLFTTRTGKQFNRVNLSKQIKGKLDVSVHKLRHYFAHREFERTKDVLVVNKLLEQASLEVTRNYLQEIEKSINYSDNFKRYDNKK